MTEVFLLPLVVLLPLLMACFVHVLADRFARPLQWMGGLAMTALVLALVAHDAPMRALLGGWEAPLGIELVADRLAKALLVFTLVVYAAVLPYAESYFAQKPVEARRFRPLAWLLWAACNAAFLSNDLFNLYVTLELAGLTAVGLAALSGHPKALAAALRYLLAALLAANLFLLGLALLYGSTGVLSLGLLAAAVAPGTATLFAFVLLVVALALKTALLPLHSWLPPAHGGAVTPVSALLSALVIKVSFAILLKLWLHFAPVLDLVVLGQGLAVLGALAVVWGSLLALRQQRLKMLVAYSTVAQVGYLFLPFAWLRPGTPAAAVAFDASVLQMLGHGFAKAAMFLAAGVLLRAAGRDGLEGLQGAASRQPLAVFALGLAGISLIGLPPSLGFSAKWSMLQAALLAGQWPWVLLLLTGSLLTAAYVFRAVRYAFLPASDASELRPVPALMSYSALLLAVLAAFGGLGTATLGAWLEIGIAGWPQALP